MRTTLVSKLAIVLLLGLTPAMRATTIFIADAGFEDPTTDVSTAGSITGWTITGSGAGVWNLHDHPTGFWGVDAPEGKQIAFVGRESPAGPASISQVLGDTLLADTLYTLTGQVGHPSGFGGTLDPPTFFTFELLAGNTVLATGSDTGPEGMFSSFQLTFNSTGSSLVGQALQVRLSSNQAQSGFDNIQLSASPSVPEPSTFILLAGAMLGVLVYRGKKYRLALTR
jgi:PEP-CTERM motif